MRALPWDFGLFQVAFEFFAFILVKAHAPREFLRGYDDAFHAGGDFEGVVFHVFARPAEDGVQQFFFGRKFGLGLGRDLAHQDVARVHEGAHADYAVFVQVAELFFADVGDVAGEFFAAQLGFADFDVEFLDVDGGVDVVFHEVFADDDGVLEVESVPGHEGHQGVSAQGQFALVRARPVGDDLAFFDFIAHRDDGFLILAGAFVKAHELAELVHVGTDFDVIGVDLRDHALAQGADQHARILGGLDFQSGRHQGRLGNQKRHGLALHVGTHQGPVGVVVFQKRNQARRYAHHLRRGHVDVLHLVDRYEMEVAVVPGDDGLAGQAAVFDLGVGRGQNRLVLLIGAQPFDLLGQLPFERLSDRA